MASSAKIASCLVQGISPHARGKLRILIRARNLEVKSRYLPRRLIPYPCPYPGTMVDEEFYNEFLKGWPILKRLYADRTRYADNGVMTPRFLGHGLAGVFAIFAALAFKRDKYWSPKLPNLLDLRSGVEVYTFGQPRMGNIEFANYAYQKLEGNIFRVTNMNDWVPRFPTYTPEIPFLHHPKEYWIGLADDNCDCVGEIKGREKNIKMKKVKANKVEANKVLYKCPVGKRVVDGLLEESMFCNAGTTDNDILNPLVAHFGPYFGHIILNIPLVDYWSRDPKNMGRKRLGSLLDRTTATFNNTYHIKIPIMPIRRPVYFRMNYRKVSSDISDLMQFTGGASVLYGQSSSCGLRRILPWIKPMGSAAVMSKQLVAFCELPSHLSVFIKPLRSLLNAFFFNVDYQKQRTQQSDLDDYEDENKKVENEVFIKASFDQYIKLLSVKPKSDIMLPDYRCEVIEDYYKFLYLASIYRKNYGLDPTIHKVVEGKSADLLAWSWETGEEIFVGEQAGSPTKPVLTKLSMDFFKLCRKLRDCVNVRILKAMETGSVDYNNRAVIGILGYPF
ncbi:hypothetical protein G9A89_002390 [Geosiphon pyriformis]|nr:hypothetical protein G9A89_002390 [Geosiphon pyriformis]